MCSRPSESVTTAVWPKLKVSADRLVDLDHNRVAQALAGPLDPGLEMRLVLLGDVVLRVLLEVAHRSRDLQPLGNLLPPGTFHLFDVGLQGGQAFGR